jgi:flavin reductase (DIM6/NTAB) family NADH-FMN oxidoreductase RutF
MSDELSTLPPIDAKTFWRTLGERATGMTIVAARGHDGPAGFLGLSATHVTADPATMLVSIDRKTSALKAVVEGRHFAVSLPMRFPERQASPALRVSAMANGRRS